jgi:hypothetical protein
LFLVALGKAAGDRSGREAVNVLRELLGLQRAQEALLRQVDVKLDALLDRPYETGRRQLRLALMQGREPGERRELLNDARRSFIEAHAHPAAVARSLAALYLAAVWAALDSREDVQASLQEAHVEALRGADVESQRAQTGIRKPTRPKPLLAVPEERTLIALANHVALARRDWGEPPGVARIVVGFAMPERPPPHLRPLEQARWMILNTGGWGLSVGGIDYSTTPVEQRSAASDEVVKWVREMDRSEGHLLYGHIESWLERHAYATET